MTANNHNGPGEIFSELLNEEVLKPKQVAEATPEGIKPRIECYTLPTVAAAPESEVKKQWQALRNFYRSGENTQGTSSKDLRPVLLASYLNSDEVHTDYPIYLSHTEAEGLAYPSPINALLEETFKAVFKEKEGLVLHANLPRIEAALRKYVKDAGHYCDFAAALESAMSTLADIKIKGEDQKTFLADIEKFRNKLPQNGSLLGFSPLALVQLLTHLLTHQAREKRNKFIHEAHHLKSKLNDLLSVENEGKTTNSAAAWDIGDSFIEFNTLDNLKPRRASESMPVKRYERITACIRNLEAAESLLLSHHGLVYMGENLANKAGNWKDLLPALEVKLVPEGKSCLSASEGFKDHMIGLAGLIAATRMAALEINNKYEEDIHDDFFAKFSWAYFTAEENALCPPVIVLEETQNLLGREMQHFSALLASNKPVKVVAINLPSDVKIHYSGEEDELPSFQQELSSIAISHRSAFTLQAALHNPLHLVQGLDAGLACATPALFHILMPDDSQTPARQFMHISSAVEGRQFPLFTYDASREKWGSRFDIDANPQAYLDWPEYTFEMLAETKEVTRIDLAFTFADYYAVNPANLIHLYDVPAHCWTADLIPLADYLKLPTDQLYAKVPFIWMVDAEFILHKMAVPYALVVAAKERLDFWNFIQELGGVSSFHVEQAVGRTRKEMGDQIEKEVTELKARHELEIEKVRSTAGAEAMDRLASILLDLESISPATAVTAKPTAAPEVASTAIPESKPTVVEANDKAVEISSEAWVESYRCTSCNECTDKYPRAFRYNGDKQAYVADATTVTFAQLVKAAQACPAKCIHPGMPHNPKEPGLDALIELAKALN